MTLELSPRIVHKGPLEEFPYEAKVVIDNGEDEPFDRAILYLREVTWEVTLATEHETLNLNIPLGKKQFTRTEGCIMDNDGVLTLISQVPGVQTILDEGETLKDWTMTKGQRRRKKLLRAGRVVLDIALEVAF